MDPIGIFPIVPKQNKFSLLFLGQFHMNFRPFLSAIKKVSDIVFLCLFDPHLSIKYSIVNLGVHFWGQNCDMY